MKKQQIIQQCWRQKSISKQKIMHWMHLRPLNPKHVIEESKLEEFLNVLAKKIGDSTLSDQAFMTLHVQVIIIVSGDI